MSQTSSNIFNTLLLMILLCVCSVTMGILLLNAIEDRNHAQTQPEPTAQPHSPENEQANEEIADRIDQLETLLKNQNNEQMVTQRALIETRAEVAALKQQLLDAMVQAGTTDDSAKSSSTQDTVTTVNNQSNGFDPTRAIDNHVQRMLKGTGYADGENQDNSSDQSTDEIPDEDLESGEILTE